jgi:RNA polymerase sigma-70 factor (ECF subfamily)
VPSQNEIENAWMQDEKAFEQLFRNLYEPLCQSANTILNDRDESEETVQHVFITLWEKRRQMEMILSVKSYLYQAVRNASLNRIRHAKVKQLYIKEHLMVSPSAEPAVNIPLRNELQEQIQQAIESLPEQCRIIFKLSRFEEMKYAEIAEQLGISVKTVENQMGKALRVMREKLKDYLILVILIIDALLLR